MTITSADLCKAINTAWDASTLDATFQTLWSDASLADEFSVLNDQEAPGGQPFPYVVMDQPMQATTSRQSSGDGSNIKREIRDVEVKFNVYIEGEGDDIDSAKAVAAGLAEAVMAVFGGHPTIGPTGTITLTNGKHLITQFQTEYGVQTSEDVYQWVITYLFRLDVPVAV